jgi:hypothetical protein
MFCANPQLLETFRECNKLLDQVQKGLSAYLETKRGIFARFYFLSDDELLEILSQTKDPKAVQPHMRKCFDNIAALKFEDDLRMSAFISAEGESVSFNQPIYPKVPKKLPLLNNSSTLTMRTGQRRGLAADGRGSDAREPARNLLQRHGGHGGDKARQVGARVAWADCHCRQPNAVERGRDHGYPGRANWAPGVF